MASKKEAYLLKKEATTQSQLCVDVSFQKNRYVRVYEEEMWGERSHERTWIGVEQETPHHYLKREFKFLSESDSQQEV